MAVEEHPYTIESRTADYEVRHCAALIVAETRIEAGFGAAGSRGFRILSEYLAGHNESRTQPAQGPFTARRPPFEKIAMSTPVNLVQTPWGILVQFTMPVGCTLASLPRPSDDRVHLREIPPRRIAVSRYTGSWSEGNFLEHRRELVTALKLDGFQTTGETTFARYNSPFQFWFLRRNEIWIEVTP